MQLELKNVRLGFGSEETLNFKADLYVDGKKFAMCENTGKGGSTDICPYNPFTMKALKPIEAFARTLPPVVYDFGTFQQTLDGWVDQQVDLFLTLKDKARFVKKMDKLAIDYIVVYDEEQGKAFPAGWKNRSLTELLKTDKGTFLVRDLLARTMAGLLPGQVIYNKNLTHLMAGLLK